MITINRKAIAATGTTTENEPIIKSDGAGEVMQWQPSDGGADGVYINEKTGVSGLQLAIGATSAGTYAGIKSKLEVKDASHTAIAINAGVNSLAGLYFAQNTVNKWSIECLNSATPSLVFNQDGTTRLTISSAGLATFSNGVKIDAGTLQLDDVAESIDYLQSGAINFDSDNDQTGRTFTIGSGRAGGVGGGTTHLTISEATGVTEIAKVVETNGVLKENLLTNSGFDVWSNSTLEDATGTELTTTFTNQNFNTVPGSSAWNGAFVNNAASWGVGQQAVSLTAGKLYKLSFDASSVSGVAVTFGTASNTGGSNLVGVTVTAGSGNSYVFEASATTTYIMLHTSSSDAAGFTLANVSLKEVTPGCVSGTTAFDGWTKGGGLDVWREHPGSNTYQGSYYALKMNSSVATSGVHWPTLGQAQSAEFLDRFKGRTITFGAWVKTAAADDFKLRVYDNGTNSNSYSDPNVASSNFQWLEVTHTVSTDVTDLRFILFDADTAVDIYVSQPMLVFGSAIGAGNYSRPSGEVIWFEKNVGSNEFNGKTGFSDVTTYPTINLEADSNGAIPKGAKAVAMKSHINDSASSTNNVFFMTGGSTGTTQGGHVNSGGGSPNDLYHMASSWTPLDSNGDYRYYINASGSGTLDFYYGFGYYGVQLR